MTDQELALQIVELSGGVENISMVRHCATRLRLIVLDKDKIQVKKIENLDKVKGSFFNAGQYQIILGTGLVNRIYDEVIKITGDPDAGEKQEKQPAPVYGNKFQRAVRTFSDVFVPIIPVLVATGLCPSRGEARRLVQQGGVTIDDVKVASIDESLAHERFEGDGIIVRKGKKVFHRVKA